MLVDAVERAVDECVFVPVPNVFEEEFIVDRDGRIVPGWIVEEADPTGVWGGTGSAPDISDVGRVEVLETGTGGVSRTGCGIAGVCSCG